MRSLMNTGKGFKISIVISTKEEDFFRTIQFVGKYGPWKQWQ